MWVPIIEAIDWEIYEDNKFIGKYFEFVSTFIDDAFDNGYHWYFGVGILLILLWIFFQKYLMKVINFFI